MSASISARIRMMTIEIRVRVVKAGAAPSEP
jgi:hypothetical protein